MEDGADGTGVVPMGIPTPPVAESVGLLVASNASARGRGLRQYYSTH